MTRHFPPQRRRTASPSHHYPLVECGTHALAPGYIACTHVLAGAAVAHKIEPDDHLGEALCGACHELDFDVVGIDGLRLVCCHCLASVTS